jgi:hypothetical protein
MSITVYTIGGKQPICAELNPVKGTTLCSPPVLVSKRAGSKFNYFICECTVFLFVNVLKCHMVCKILYLES